jgi:hypothetical protein
MWLRGYSRDEIAKHTEIGAGTVSGIIQQCRQDDADFDLLRGVALQLRDRGMRVEDYAPLLRLKSSTGTLAGNLGISEQRLPEYLENQKNEILRLKLKTKNEVERQGATMNLLREYQANIPAFKTAMNDLEKVT